MRATACHVEPAQPLDPIAWCQELLAADMARFDAALETALAAQSEYLSEIELLLYRRGKRLRPLVLLLSAHVACPSRGAALSDKVISAAVSLEMLHVATLIHDDIVDSAPLRRGVPTVHSERGTQTAVLVGDMQFIQALRCFAHQVENDEDLRLVRLVMDVGYQICCGELDELKTDATLDAKVLHERYLKTIDRKTAMMFGLACECGASLAGGGTRAVFYLSQFGRFFGRAFQIMDDMFDLLTPSDLAGKCRGTDLMQGRLSLPLIYALQDASAAQALQGVLGAVDAAPAARERAIDAVLASPGFLRCYSRARVMILEAQGFLAPFPASPYREALSALAAHVVERGASGPTPSPGS